ncbi:MAG: carboxypeptidase regulatory-like domain-containing protein [Schlesneria sp.]
MKLACLRIFWTKKWFWAALTIAIAGVSSSPAWALITGGEGNDPVADPGWPKDAAAVFNTKSRVAYWEGPPFGGGQSHAECRGDTEAFQKVLDDFAKIDTPFKRVVLHDGIGRSFWLNPNSEKDKTEKAKIDWVFMIWQPESRKKQRQLPVGLSSVGKRDPVVLAQLDVYGGGSIHWTKVKVPGGLDVIDQRLEAHGFTLKDGVVLQGKVVDAETRIPLKATLELQKIEPQKEGGYRYTKLVEAPTDTEGRWVVKKAPQEWCRLVLTADGYASRVIGYAQYDNEAKWSEHNSELAKPGTVSGRVVDSLGGPLADATVRIDNDDVTNLGGYEIPDDSIAKTDAEGRFSFVSTPISTATVRVSKPGYVRPGLGLTIEVPVPNLKLVMQSAAKLKVTVDFSAAIREGQYLVHIEPEGGEKIGSWGGSGQIDANNIITFENVPEGKYVIHGRPNPGSTDQNSDKMTVTLKGGETSDVKLMAR